MAMAAKIYLEFHLVPLILAYFVTFLLAPLMDIVENRPYDMPGLGVLCANKFASLELWEPKTATYPLEYYRKLPADFTEEEIEDPSGAKKKTGKLIWNAPAEEEIEKRAVMTTDMWEAAKDRLNLEGGPRCVADLTQTIKLPHMVAVLWCMAATGCICYGLASVSTYYHLLLSSPFLHCN